MTDEILVHISTPATKQNDALYQSLAEAYFEFEPQRRCVFDLDREPNEEKQFTTACLNLTAPPNQGDSTYVTADPSTYSTSKDSYGSFPSHLSSDDPSKGYGPTSAQPHYGPLEDGPVPTSSRLVQLERIHMNWKAQTTPKSNFAGVARHLRKTPSNAEDANTTFIEDTQLGVQALQSQLQDTYSTTSEDTSEDDAELHDKSREDQLPAIADDPQDIGKSTVEVLPSTRLTANIISGKVNADHEGEPCLAESLKPSLPLNQERLESQNQLADHGVSIDSMDSVDFTKLPVNAFPPAPTFSVAQPGSLPSQITKYLAAIKTQNPTRFKPSKKLHIPRLDDRGYWSLSCSHWPERLQHEFWSTLCEYVLSGSLGWGSTLHREPSTRVISQVRLYCWGEVVEHMWLVLWLCSKGKVSGSRSMWYNADGVAVFEVA